MTYTYRMLAILGICMQTALANGTWEIIPGRVADKPTYLVGVRDSLWVGLEDSLMVVDSSQQVAKRMILPFGAPPKDIRWDFGLLLATTGDKTWKSNDTGKTWMLCDGVCHQVPPVQKFVSTYLHAGYPGRMQFGSRDVGILNTSKGRLVSVTGAVLRQSLDPLKPEWTLVAHGWREGIAPELYRVARGILAIPEFRYGDSAGIPVPGTRRIMLSKDEGDTWEQVRPEDSYCISAVESQGKWLCQSDWDSIAISSDAGQTWKSVEVHPADTVSGGLVKYVYHSEEDWVVVSETQGKIRFFFSENQGQTWVDRTPSSATVHVLSGPIYRVDTSWILFASNGLFITSNSGKSWTRKALPSQNASEDRFISSASKTKLWYTRHDGNRFSSNDLGTSWKPENSDAIDRLPLGQDGLLIGYQGGSKKASLDEGSTWTSLNIPLFWTASKQRMVGKHWFLLTSIGLYATEDSGKSWQSKLLVLGGDESVAFYDMDMKGDSLAFASNLGVIKTTLNLTNNIVLPLDWSGSSHYWVRFEKNTILAYDDDFFLAYYLPAQKHFLNIKTTSPRQPSVAADRIYWLSAGYTYTQKIGDSLPSLAMPQLGLKNPLPEGDKRQLAVCKGVLYCLTSVGLFQSLDTGKTWIEIPKPISPTHGFEQLKQGWKGMLISNSLETWYRSEERAQWKKLTAPNQWPGSYYLTSDSLLVICDNKMGSKIKCSALRHPDSNWVSLDTIKGGWVGGWNEKLFTASGTQLMILDSVKGQWRAAFNGLCDNKTIHSLGKRIAARETCGETKVWVSSNRGDTWRMAVAGDSLPDFLNLVENPPYYAWNVSGITYVSNHEKTLSNSSIRVLSMVVMGNKVIIATPKELYRVDFLEDATPIGDSPSRVLKKLPRLTRQNAKGGMVLSFDNPIRQAWVVTVLDMNGRMNYRSEPRVFAAGHCDWTLPAAQGFSVVQLETRP